MKKVNIYAALGLGVAIVGIYGMSSIYAQESGYRGNVSDEVRQEHMAQRAVERTEAIAQAMEEGQLTDRQLDILNAMEDIRPEGGRGMFGAGKDLTVEEREALRSEREGTMLESLNESGLDVTHEELEELKELRLELGLMGNQHKRGSRI